MHKFLVCVLSVSLALPAIAEAKEKPPISLTRTSKWELNYDEDSCHLLAKFGNGDQSAIVRLTQYGPASHFDLTVYGKPFKVLDAQASAMIGFGLAPPQKYKALAGNAGKELPLLIFSALRLDGSVLPEAPVVSPEQEAKASVIDLSIEGGQHLRLEVGSFKATMQAMRTCTTDLVTHWGYDPAQLAAVSRWPTPLTSPASWLKNGDFPIAAEGHNGLVQFRLDIDNSGNVTGCSILHRTNPDDFADLTCKLIAKRAKFDAALDKDGKPIRSYYINKVRWITIQY